MTQTIDTPKRTTKTKKAVYRVRNWKEYDKALIARGSLTLWIPENVERIWYGTGKNTYSNASIELMLTLKARFSLPLRATEGFVRSVFALMQLVLDIPDHSTVSRRAGTADIPLRKRSDKESVHVILDSTGVKVCGEGEWKVKKHGKDKHRTWTKVHLAIDRDGEIRALAVTGGNAHDTTAVDPILDQEEARITDFFGDGAYDAFGVYQTLIDRGVTGIHIPPQRNARIKVHGNCNAPPYPRDENLRAIRRSTRKRWKIASGYHARSRVETAMFRYKATFGGHMRFRRMARRQREVAVKCNILNTFHQLGMPKSEKVT